MGYIEMKIYQNEAALLITWLVIDILWWCNPNVNMGFPFLESLLNTPLTPGTELLCAYSHHKAYQK